MPHVPPSARTTFALLISLRYVVVSTGDLAIPHYPRDVGVGHDGEKVDANYTRY